MSLGSIQICGQKLSHIEIQDICKSLESNSIKCLALRECSITDKLYKSLVHSLASCKSILQLNFNLGIVKNHERLKLLCQALSRNRSLTSLFLHGSPLAAEGTKLLCKTLSIHPNIVGLDVGDCRLNDQCLTYIAQLLPPNGAKRGLQDLTLSGNSSVTSAAWVKFFIALASSNTLKRLYLDYTELGDEGVNCLAVALATNRSLQVLDLEGTGITEQGGQVLQYLVSSFPVVLTEVVLAENLVKKSTKDSIAQCLQENNKANHGTESHMTSTMESDASSLASITESAITGETQSVVSDLESTADVSEALSTLQIDESETASSGSETETIISVPQSKRLHSQTRYSRPINAHVGRPFTHSDVPNPGNQRLRESTTSDNEDNMGTMLIGETLPGYYANPVRISPFSGGYRRSPFDQGGGDMLWGSGGYGAVHPQSAAQVAYADSQ